MSASSPRRRWVLSLLLLLAAVLSWWWRPALPVTRTPPVETGPVSSPPAEAVPAVGPAVSAGGQSSPAGIPAGLAEIVRQNTRPGRILFLDFTLGPDGLKLVGASGAAGRAKAPGSRTGPGLIQYEVSDASGRISAAGWVEDPTRRRVEYAPEGGGGRMTSAVLPQESGPFVVRLAGEDRAHRIRLFRDREPAAGAGAARELLGDFVLQPATIP